MGQLPFWWQRGTLKLTEVKPLAQPHRAETTERGLNPRLSGSEIHAYSPPPSVSCPDEVVLGWDEVENGGDQKEVQYKTFSATWTPQIALCFGAGPINHAKFILLSYVWLAFTIFDLKLMSFLVVVLSTFHLRICLVFSCPTTLHFRCKKWRHW